MLAEILSEWGVGAVLVSSLIGHSLDALRTGLPTAVCTHDYYPLWPILHADFGGTDADWSDDALRMALRQRDAHSPFQPRDAQHWIELRSAYVAALLGAHTTMVCPIAGIVANQQRIAPALAALGWRTIPHGFAGWPDAARSAVLQSLLIHFRISGPLSWKRSLFPPQPSEVSPSGRRTD